MPDFIAAEDLLSKLVNSLYRGWRSPYHGLYESGVPSTPTKSYTPTPSFTCSGLALQAFNESGSTSAAHEIADELFAFVKEGRLFPNEKASGQGSFLPHIICNSWPLFSMLECYPRRSAEVRHIVQWLLDARRDDGSWPLIPDHNSRYPIVTAYAISALLRFCESNGPNMKADDALLWNAAASIFSGVSYLLNIRSPEFKAENLYLWPESLNQAKSDNVSLGTSAMCMHVVSKCSRLLETIASQAQSSLPAYGRMDLLEDPEILRSRVVGTFGRMIEGYKGIDRTTSIGKTSVSFDDIIMMNEDALNYTFCFFAPINLVTVLRFLDKPELRDKGALLNFIDDLVLQITENVGETREGLLGVRSRGRKGDIKAWSTALSVIVLSRVVKTSYRIAAVERAARRSRASISRGTMRLVEQYLAPVSMRKVTLAYSLLILAILAYAGWLVYRHYREPRWNMAFTGLGFLLALVALVVPITRRRVMKILENVITTLRNVVITPRIVRELQNLRQNQGR